MLRLFRDPWLATLVRRLRRPRRLRLPPAILLA
jgi:hypothetical protein